MYFWRIKIWHLYFLGCVLHLEAASIDRACVFIWWLTKCCYTHSQVTTINSRDQSWVANACSVKTEKRLYSFLLWAWLCACGIGLLGHFLEPNGNEHPDQHQSTCVYRSLEILETLVIIAISSTIAYFVRDSFGYFVGCIWYVTFERFRASRLEVRQKT